MIFFRSEMVVFHSKIFGPAFRSNSAPPCGCEITAPIRAIFPAAPLRRDKCKNTLRQIKNQFILSTFCSLLFFVACSPPANPPKQATTQSTTPATVIFSKQKFENQINAFSTEVSKKYKIQQDSISAASVENKANYYFSGFAITNKNQNNKIKFQFYGFSTAAPCDTAQQKILKKIGDLKKIKPGKNLRYIKSSPCYIIKNKFNIILMEFACENNLPEKEIANLKELLQQQFASPKSEVINVECGGPLEWL